MCGLDVDQDGITDLLLVAAPMFLGSGNKEAGRVYIYSLSGVNNTARLTEKIVKYENLKLLPLFRPTSPAGRGLCAQWNSEV